MSKILLRMCGGSYLFRMVGGERSLVVAGERMGMRPQLFRDNVASCFPVNRISTQQTHYDVHGGQHTNVDLPVRPGFDIWVNLIGVT